MKTKAHIWQYNQYNEIYGQLGNLELLLCLKIGLVTGKLSFNDQVNISLRKKDELHVFILFLKVYYRLMKFLVQWITNRATVKSSLNFNVQLIRLCDVTDVDLSLIHIYYCYCFRAELNLLQPNNHYHFLDITSRYKHFVYNIIYICRL